MAVILKLLRKKPYHNIYEALMGATSHSTSTKIQDSTLEKDADKLMGKIKNLKADIEHNTKSASDLREKKNKLTVGMTKLLKRAHNLKEILAVVVFFAPAVMTPGVLGILSGGLFNGYITVGGNHIPGLAKQLIIRSLARF